MKNSMIVFLLASLFAFAGCSSDDLNAPTAPADDVEAMFPVNEDMPGETTEFFLAREATGDIVDVAIAQGFTKLAEAVTAAGLVETLQGDGPFTVFAPTDTAFENLPDGLLDALLERPEKLGQLLAYHVIAGAAVESRDLRFFQRVESFEGSDLEILRFFRLILVNGVRVQLADVPATNGVIHVIDEVLIPEGFSLEDEPAPTLDLVGLAGAAGLNKLAEFAAAAGLVETLQSEGPFTVFAPTDAAFEALPAGLVEEVSADVELLQDLLLYHVVSGAQVLSTDLNFFQRVEMAQGDKTFVFKTRRGVFVNFSRVVSADNLATNGVAHVIDRVLIPPHFYGLLRSLPAEAPEMGPDLHEELARN